MTLFKGTRSSQRAWATVSGLALAVGLMTATSAQAETGADSRTTTRTYNDYGQVTSVDGPRTDVLDVTAYEYDERGNRLTVTNALGHETRYSNYERNGLPGTVTDPNGRVTHLQYDWQGKISEQRVEAPEGDLVTRYVYDPVGQLIEIHPPSGASLYYEYDAAQRLVGLRTDSGARLDYERDDLGNIVSIETRDALGTLVRRHQQAYDGLSRLQARIGGTDGQTTDYDYDADGNRTGITDPKQQSASQQFDALNRLTEVTDRAQGTTDFEYNDRDQIVAVTDPKGLTTRYDYNGHGDLIAVHSPDTGTTTYDYDEAGNRIRQTDANGQVVETDYDALNRRTAIRYPATPERTVTFEYDDTSADETGTANAGLGRLTAVRFAGGERRYRYDTLGRLVAETQVIDSNEYTQRYVYNAQGQLSARQLPSGAWLGYDYSDAGRLAGLYLQPDATATTDQRQPIVTDLDYLPFGPVTHLTYGNGIEQTNDYDLDYRLTEQRSPVWDSGYYYDPNSNLDQIIDYLAGAGSDDNPGDGDASGLFRYDALDRLITAEQTDTSRDYRYDPVGNRLDKTTTTDTETASTDYGYASQSHRLLTEADWSYEYDDAGNLLSNGRFDFEYNEQGQLARVTEAGTDTVVASYRYNARRQRIEKAVPYSGPDHASSAQRTHYVYNPNGMIQGEYTEDGTAIREYVYLGNRPIAIISPAENAANDTTYNRYYLHSDHLGTPKVITDQNQGTVWQATHSPFGKATLVKNQIDNPIRFPGQLYDPETGLHYNWHRYYDPGTGRYITSDPIGLQGGYNTYGYVLQNPINFADPKGLETEVLIGGSHWYEHAAINVNGTVYSNGRYPVPGTELSSGGTVGPNVLTVQSASSYYEASNACSTCDTEGYELNLSPAQEAEIEAYFQNLINESVAHPTRSNWYVLQGNYSFVGNNCSSLVIKALYAGLPWYQSASLPVPQLSTPNSLGINLSLSPFLVSNINQYQAGD